MKSILILALSLLCIIGRSVGDNGNLDKNFQYTGYDLAYSMTIDESDDSIYLWCQKSTGVVSLVKLNSLGAKQWDNSFGTISNAGDQTMTPPVIDPSTGDVYVTGYASAAPGAQIDASLPNALNSGWHAYYSAGRADWRGLAWSPELGIFVATTITTDFGAVMTSPDGMKWTRRPIGNGNAWHGLTWSSKLGIFVATAINGTSDRVMTSANGIDWTVQSTPAANEWRSVVWAAELDLFVAVASSGAQRVMTSRDGKVWELQTGSTDAEWVSVAWSPKLGLLVAVAHSGIGNRLMISVNNGTTWETKAPYANNDWKSVIWSAEKAMFVAVASQGNNDRVMTSKDGFNWNGTFIPGDSRWNSVVWANEVSLFVAVARLANDSQATQVMTSTNGATWTMMTPGANALYWNSICWSPQLRTFVAVADEFSGLNRPPTVMAWRTEVANINAEWKRQTHPPTEYFGPVVWAPELSLFVAVSNVNSNSLVMSSPNGVNWTSHNTPTELRNGRGLCWSPERGIFVATCSNGIMTSSNGKNWTLTQVTSYEPGAVTWSPERELFVATVRNCADLSKSVITSPDGTTWTLRTTPTPAVNWGPIVWSAKLGLFVSVGDRYLNSCAKDDNILITSNLENSTNVMTSTNGTTWTAQVVPADLWNSIAYSPELGIFAITSWSGGEQKIMWSRDGVNWYRANVTPLAIHWVSITWCNRLGLFIALSSGMYCGNHCAMVSPNGIDWTPINSPPLGYLSTAAYSPKLNLLVAAAHQSSMATNYILTWQQQPSEYAFVSRIASNGTRLSTQYLRAYGNTRTTGLKLLGDNLIIVGNRQNIIGPDWTGFIHAIRKSDFAEVWYSPVNAINTSTVIHSIDVDQRNGLIYVGGAVSGAAFDTQIYVGNRDAFVARYTSAGVRTHVRQYGYIGNDQVMSLVLDSRRSAVYATGRLGGQINSVSTFYQSLAKFSSSDLSLVWLTPVAGGGGAGYGLTVNPFNGDVYVTGEQTSAFPSISSAVQTIYYGGSSDCSFAVFSPSNGALLRSITFGSSGADTCRSVAVRGDGSVGISGRLDTTASFFSIKLASAVAPAVPLACNTTLFDAKFTEAMQSTSTGRWYAVATGADCRWTSASNHTDSVAASSACLSTCRLQSAYPDSCVLYKLNQVLVDTSVSLTQTATRTLPVESFPVVSTNNLTVPQTVTATVTNLPGGNQTILTVTATLNSGGSSGGASNNNGDTQNQLNMIIYTVSAGVGGLLVGAMLMFLIRKRRAVTNNNQKSLPAVGTNFSMTNLLSRQAADSQLRGSAGNLVNSSAIPMSIYTMQSPAEPSPGAQWPNRGVQNSQVSALEQSTPAAWNPSRPQQYF